MGFASVCQKATEQVLQAVQSDVHCVNLCQLFASQQSTDHIAEGQISAWEKSLNLSYSGVASLKGRSCSTIYLFKRDKTGATN